MGAPAGYAYIANPTKVNYTADYVAFSKSCLFLSLSFCIAPRVPM